METQHYLNLPWRLSPRFELVLHSRARTRPGSLEIYQARAGAILNTRVKPRVELITGYYFSEQEEAVADWEGISRYFGGAELLHFNWKGRWASRHIGEFHNGPFHEHLARFRHRFGWEAPTRIAPFSSTEFFWDKNGWRSTRYLAGTAFTVSPRIQFDLHYFYEPRRDDVGTRPRHMWGSTMEIRIGPLETSRP